MKLKEAVDIIEGLIENADELGKNAEKYKVALTIALYETSNSRYRALLLDIMEDKLKERIGAEEYTAFAKECAKEAFIREVEAMPDSDFKKYCLDHMAEITSDSWEEQRLS